MNDRSAETKLHRYDIEGGRLIPSDSGEYVTYCAAHAFYSRRIAELETKNHNLWSTVHSRQAKIDELMMEFCPGEMSTEQRKEWGDSQRAVSPPPASLPADPRELLVTTARDAGFDDLQWQSMFYDKGPYDVTYPTDQIKQFAKLLIERLAPHDEHCDVNDQIIKGKPCNCRNRVPVETPAPQCPNCDSAEVGTFTADNWFLYGVEKQYRLVAKDVLFFRCMACSLEYTGEDGEQKRDEAVRDHLARVATSETGDRNV